MKQIFSRTVATAIALALMAGAPQAALAQKDKKAPSYKFSKPVQSLLAKAQKAQQDNDPQALLGFLREAEALPNKNADDIYMINIMSLNAGIMTKDNALIEKSIEGALASGRVSDEEKPKFLRNLGALALQRNDTAKALQYFEQLLALNPSDPQLISEVAELHRRQGQPQKAVQTMQQAIKVQEAGGAKADEAWYRRVLAIAYDSKLPAETAAASDALVANYPNPTNWRDALVIFRDSNKFDDQGNLDILRLMRANNALAGERDYVEYAETAALRGYPGESSEVLKEGVAKGTLDAKKPMVKELQAAVNPKVASDKGSLPGLEKEANKAPNGRSALATADAYLGYGNYQKAAELYRLALKKGGVDANVVNTRLGLSLGKTGDKAGAEAALKAVTGAPRDRLAQFYLIWLGQQS